MPKFLPSRLVQSAFSLVMVLSINSLSFGGQIFDSKVSAIVVLQFVINVELGKMKKLSKTVTASANYNM
jgi:hypothetical protein